MRQALKATEDSERLGSYYEDLGAAVLVCARSEPFRSFSLRALSAWIAPAVHHGQISFFCDKRGWPTGFVTWAHFSAQTEDVMMRDPAYIPRLCEWNEGPRTHVITLVAQNGLLHSFVRHILRDMFAASGFVSFFGRRPIGDRRQLFRRSLTSVR